MGNRKPAASRGFYKVSWDSEVFFFSMKVPEKFLNLNLAAEKNPWKIDCFFVLFCFALLVCICSTVIIIIIIIIIIICCTYMLPLVFPSNNFINILVFLTFPKLSFRILTKNRIFLTPNLVVPLLLSICLEIVQPHQVPHFIRNLN